MKVLTKMTRPCGCGEGKTTFLYIIHITLILFESTTASSVWYQGCYTLSEDHLREVTQRSSDHQPVSCGRACVKSQLPYCAVRIGSGCACLSQPPAKTPGAACNASCSDLPCGGTASSWSVYSSAGPYLTNLNVVAEPKVYLGHPVSIEIRADLASDAGISLGINEFDGDPRSLSVSGQGASVPYHEDQDVEETQLSTVWQPTLNIERVYHLVVSVSNVISSVTKHLNITVIYPKPEDLLITLKRENTEFPSCIPTDVQQHITGKPQTLYRRVPLTFEAVVSVGVNLIFNWSITKLSKATIRQEIYAESKQCHGPCLATSIEYTFQEEGQYNLKVDVVHERGQLSESIHVVVVDPVISDFKVDLTENGVHNGIVIRNRTTTFRISMETTSRKDLVLVADFGDHDIKRYELEHVITSAGTSVLTEGPPQQDTLHITSSYSEGCLLTVQLNHAYLQEGVFKPQFNVYNRFSNLTKGLERDVVVLSQLYSAVLHVSRVTAVNITTFITASLEVASSNQTLHWKISRHGNNSSPIMISNTNLELVHVFVLPGHYIVEVEVVNTISSVEARAEIQVEIQVLALHLTSVVENNYFNVSEELTFNANVDQGSNVQFEWNISSNDDVVIQLGHSELSSTARCLFSSPGVYNVSVTAFNDYNVLTQTLHPHIVIQRPISSLVLLANTTAVRGQRAYFEAKVQSGSSVRFEFEVGHDRITNTTGISPNHVSISKTFTSVGTYNVKVSASNEVSSSSQSVYVEVQEIIPNMTLKRIFTPIQREQVVFVVESNDVPLKRKDVIFSWYLDTSYITMTASPLFNLSFESVGLYNMTVIGKNYVNQKVAVLMFNVHNVSSPPGLEPRFTQGPITIKGQQKEFNIVNIPLGPVDIYARFTLGNNTHDLDRMEDTEGTFFSWNHQFHDTGLYTVHVNCVPKPSGPAVLISSFMVVEEPITDLALAGPKAVAVTRASDRHRWVAVMSGGSHVVYMWGQGSNFTHVSTKKVLQQGFTREGVYTLAVMASNALGSAVAYANVTVQHSISFLHVTASTTVTGTMFDIDIMISGSPSFKFHIDFGDGNTTLLSSRDTLKLIPQPPREGAQFTYRLHHQYSVSGQHTLGINASNLVSHKYKQIVVNVEEKLTGLEVVSPTTSLIATDTAVVVTASVRTGDHLKFHVDFGEKLFENIPSYNRTCTVSYIYSRPGRYRVSVSVSNPYTVAPLYKELPHQIHVVEPVTGLQIVRTVNTGDCVELKKRQSANFSTDQIGFKASLLTGSEVAFRFDFGDGHQINQSVTHSSVTHTYNQAGEFRVTVIATNPLNSTSVSLSRKVCVQTRPDGVGLDSQFYKTRFGNATKFQVTFKRGTLLEFDWIFGDGTVLHREVSELSHTYASPNKYDVVVSAKNRVGQQNSSAIVYVQELIRGVSVVASEQVQKVKSAILFRATPDPEFPYGVNHFVWNIDGKEKRTLRKEISHVFPHSGQFSVTAKAVNYQGNKTSDPVVVEIISLISNLTLTVTGEMVVGKELVFFGKHYFGNNVDYKWTFEENVTVETKDREMRHTYLREGEYHVTLVASNALSTVRASVTVFITRTYCYTPDIVILGDQLKFLRSTEIRVETDVKINCSLTDKTLYDWSLFYDQDYQRKVLLPNVKEHIMHESFLFLPARILPYGKYYLLLKVTMQDQIVRTNRTREITITQSPMISVIRGGIQRNVNRNEKLILNGTLSYDPDFPHQKDLKFKWECFQLLAPKSPCFNVDTPPEFNTTGAIVELSGHRLKPDVQAFVFNLTVWRVGRLPSTVSQVVQMEGTAVIDVNVLCVQCNAGVMNMDQRLVLEALHSQFLETEVTYTWKIEVVLDGSNALLARVHDRGQCVKGDNSTYHQYMLASTTTARPTPSPGSVVSTTKPTTTGSPATTRHAPTIGNGGIPISEGGSDDHGRPPGGIGFPLIGEGDSTGGRPFLPPAEESGGGHLPDRGTQGGPQVPATDDQEQERARPNVVNMEREEVLILSDQTTTGLRRRVLVLRENVLEQGRTYMVGVTITHKGSLLQGHAWTYFRVNQSPVTGICTSNPGQGIEMETKFEVVCFEWKDTEQPLSYLVSYSLSDDQTPDLIYQGLNSQITFQLPAGEPSKNYHMKIHISVLDGLGAKTTVCSMSIQVKPKLFDISNKTEEEILYYMVEQDKSTLQAFIQRGDNRNARLHTQMVASRLNRLQAPSNNGSLEWREKTRRAMLWALKDLPIRNDYEIQQITSAVAITTAVSQELNEASMNFTTTILQKASNQMLTMASITKATDDGSSMLVLKGASNVLHALTKETYKRLTSDATRNLVEKSNQVVQTLLKASVKHLVTGEKAVQKKTDVINAMAGKFKRSTVANLTTENASFVLPTDLKTVLDGAEMRSTSHEEQAPEGDQEVVRLEVGDQTELSMLDEDCYQAQMVTYNENPYDFGQEQKTIHTRVASLTLFNCQGGEMVIENLTDSDTIGIILPHHPKQELKDVFVLKKLEMNIHQFNMSDENILQSLHIDITLIPTDKGRVFPVAVLLRADNVPRPDNYLKKWTYEAQEEIIKIRIETGLLTEGTQYFIGIVDASYNDGRPRPGEVQERQYTLNMWWGQCLYWNKQAADWSPNGCSIKGSSSYFEAHCSCKHLSTFGAHLSLAPNNLDFTKVEDFFDLNENPVTFSLITSLLLLYIIVLVVCIRKDRLDRNNSPLVFHLDNTYTDRQVYIVTIETGFRNHAGTSAKVSMVLHGQEGMSETRELVSETGHSLFQRNSRDTFIMTFPESLGHIFKVQIWHNNAGASPSWYLSRVIVRDATTGRIYYFICEKWFAVEKEDETVQREIMVSENGLSFRKVVWAKSTQYFADHHLWFSTLTRPSYSPFTRAQRLTCCVCLMMSYMAVNAAWYRSTEKEYRGEFGLIDISWRSVAVGIISSLLVLPFNYILVVLFRKSKVKHSLDDSAHDVISDNKNKRDSMSSISSAGRILQPVIHPSIFDQTIISWQNLQDWAQKTWTKRHSDIALLSDQADKKGQTGTEQQTEDGQQKQVFIVRKDSDGDNRLISTSTGTEEDPTTGNDVTSVKTGSEQLSYVADSETGEILDDKNTSVEKVSSSAGRSLAKEHSPFVGTEYLLTSAGTDADLQPGQTPPKVNNQSRDSYQEESQTSEECQKHSAHGSPKSERSTLVSDMSCSTPSSGKTGTRIPRCTPRSQLSVTRSDYSGTPPVNITYLKSCQVVLPAACQYIAWILSVIIICGCATVTVLFGFRFGKVKSVQWIQSLFFSVVQCIFITHPILIVMVAVGTALRYRKDLSVFDIFDNRVVERIKTEMTRLGQKAKKTEEIQFGDRLAARQRSRYLRFARPPQEKQIIESRNKTIKEKKASAIINETSLFVVQFISLIIMVFGKNQKPIFALNQTFKDVFVNSGNHGNPAFSSLDSVPQWWLWTHSQLVDSLFWNDWYNGQPTNFDNNYVGNSVLVGHVNLRQLRIKEQSCSRRLPPPYSYVTSRCRYDYSSTTKSRSAFGQNTTWWHLRSESTGAHDISGKHAHYDGDGFLVMLSRNRAEAVAQLKMLQTGEYIDQLTRAVVVEFTLFHPASNLFSSIKLLTEFPSTGGIFTSHFIKSAYLYKYVSTFDNFVLACEMMFVIITFFRLYSIMNHFLNSKLTYLKHFWHWCQVTQGLLSLAYIICFVYRFILVGSTIEYQRATYHEIYVDISTVAEWDHVLQSLIGFVTFLTLVQLIQALRHRKPFAVFQNVLHHASMDLIVVGLVFSIWLGAYTCLGSALFATVSPHYSTASSSIMTTAGLFTHHCPRIDQHMGDVWNIHGFRAFVVFILLTVSGFLTSYIVAVLNFHYKVYRHETILVFSTQETLLYYWNQFLIFFGLKYPQLLEEDDTLLPPEFTMAEIEYQVDEMLFKMNALTGSSNLPEKNPIYFTDSDATYGAGEDGMSSGASEMPGFEEEKFGSRVHKIKDNILSHETYLAQLIELDTNEDYLAQEKEKHLRTQLELEIFRQLQLERNQFSNAQYHPPTSTSSSNGYQASLSHSSSNCSGGKQAVTGDSLSHSSSNCSGGKQAVTGDSLSHSSSNCSGGKQAVTGDSLSHSSSNCSGGKQAVTGDSLSHSSSNCSGGKQAVTGDSLSHSSSNCSGGKQAVTGDSLSHSSSNCSGGKQAITGDSQSQFNSTNHKNVPTETVNIHSKESMTNVTSPEKRTISDQKLTENTSDHLTPKQTGEKNSSKQSPTLHPKILQHKLSVASPNTAGELSKLMETKASMKPSNNKPSLQGSSNNKPTLKVPTNNKPSSHVPLSSKLSVKMPSNNKPVLQAQYGPKSRTLYDQNMKHNHKSKDIDHSLQICDQGELDTNRSAMVETLPKDNGKEMKKTVIALTELNVTASSNSDLNDHKDDVETLFSQEAMPDTSLSSDDAQVDASSSSSQIIPANISQQSDSSDASLCSVDQGTDSLTTNLVDTKNEVLTFDNEAYVNN